MGGCGAWANGRGVVGITFAFSVSEPSLRDGMLAMEVVLARSKKVRFLPAQE
jgi:hypothetical protein